MKARNFTGFLRWLGGLLIFATLSAEAGVNSWVNSTSGNWDDAASWSLGVLPDSTQSVMITNAGWKAVAINPSTPGNFPGAMSVSNLTILSPTNTRNTLLMNYVAAGYPLVIGVDSNAPGSLIIGSDSTLTMYSSGLIVNNTLGAGDSLQGEFAVNGMFIQSDDSEVVAGFLDLTGMYNLTNGMVFIGNQFINGTFNQQGGVNTGTLELQSTNGDYELFDGVVQGDVAVNAGTFRQWAGTNSVNSMSLSLGGYFKNGGSLFAGNLNVVGSVQPIYFPPGPGMTQFGGTTIVTNDLIVEGAGNRHAPAGATCNLYGGSISANRIRLEQAGMFTQTNGTVVTSDLYITDNASLASVYNLFGGTLSTSNTTIISSWPENSSVIQRGGTQVISNTLSIFNWGVFEFTGGTLSASNINVTGNFVIGDGFGNRINNSGYFSLSHLLQISNAVEQLGRFILADNSTINLAGEASKLSFANSSAESWNPAAKLIVTDWNALTSEHYAGDNLKFGTNQFGLTTAQLQRIHFINPAGFAPGDYAAQITGDGSVYPAGPASGDLTNDWTGVDGFWHDLTWSLGVRPDSSQSVRIIGGNRTVTVNATTAASYPESLTVHDLTVSGYVGTPSLVLSNAGTLTPLRVLNGLLVKDGATLVNLNSGLVVDATEVTVTNAQIIQDGGFVRVTNATTRLLYGAYYMTNGVFEGGTVWAGTPYPALPGQFNQYGGSVRIADLALNNQYSLYGGTLDLPGGMSMNGRASGTSYFQSGGTNRTPFITMWDGYGGGGPSLTLNGGLLAVGDVDVHSGWYGSSTVTQNGGTHSITNAFLLAGGATTGATVRPARYHLNAGTLSARIMELNGNQGDAIFVQTNGTVSAETVFAHSVGYYGSFVIQMTLTGGSLSCSNFTLDDGRGSFTQSGGALTVSNLLTITGYRDLLTRYYGQYIFTGGTVTASNINIASDWVIGDGTSNRISNPGFFSLSHLLQINNAIEQLGRFILATNATIDLSGSASRLSFANSSGETWKGGATLTILNWNGNSSGGGAEQLKFGNNALGLTTTQLSRIRFMNPGGFPSGTYFAQILNTGEIVPTTGATLTQGRQGNNLVLDWPVGWTLQTATNVLGPYVDLTTATSPYTNDMTTAPQAFFRLRQ